MNNNDVSYLMKMLSNMDKSKLSQGLEKINQILSPEEKQRLIQALNSQKKSWKLFTRKVLKSCCNSQPSSSNSPA